MTKRGARKLRAKSVRSLLTYAHYRFQGFLIWKAWQNGKDVILVNEAYTSKTCSWSGEIIENLGGRRIVTGSDGTRVDRDINGARGIFLRALGDTPLCTFTCRDASATTLLAFVSEKVLEPSQNQIWQQVVFLPLVVYHSMQIHARDT